MIRLQISLFPRFIRFTYRRDKVYLGEERFWQAVHLYLCITGLSAR